MSRFNADAPTVIGRSYDDERIKRMEQQLERLTNTLQGFFTLGRLRFDRTAPANSADVQSNDLLYDIVRDTSYEYVLINDAGALAWRRISMSSF